MEKDALTSKNALFWNELCGSWLAVQLGIKECNIESLKKFDDSYFELYPYLLKYVPVEKMRDAHVLEVGLGYGALGYKIAGAGTHYTGLDISPGPVGMMAHRMQMSGIHGLAIQGSMLACPVENDSQDFVVSIGCFHHTGNVQRCLDETWRVLKPGGEAILMVYNQFSYRQWLRWPMETLKSLMVTDRPKDSASISDAQRKAYDPNIAGQGAPETVFLSTCQLKAMMSRFSDVTITKENCRHVTWRGRTIMPRRVLLGTIGRLCGLDLYIHAKK